jgi:hypothetical protein
MFEWLYNFFITILAYFKNMFGINSNSVQNENESPESNVDKIE